MAQLAQIQTEQARTQAQGQAQLTTSLDTLTQTVDTLSKMFVKLMAPSSNNPGSSTPSSSNDPDGTTSSAPSGAVPSTPVTPSSKKSSPFSLPEITSLAPVKTHYTQLPCADQCL
jgi:hypothetical protein